ncbi:hypothetical protein WJX77_003462 [Trebouxia sp. C0004]
MNLTFSPWQVMGPVDTNGTGYAILTYVGGQLDYEFHLFNVRGLQSVELHVGMQTEHGDVAAVFYKAPFANVSQVSNGRVAAGTLTSYDLLGPFLLPLGEHLEVSMVYDGYVNEGLATVVVHTLVNPGCYAHALMVAVKRWWLQEQLAAVIRMTRKGFSLWQIQSCLRPILGAHIAADQPHKPYDSWGLEQGAALTHCCVWWVLTLKHSGHETLIS